MSEPRLNETMERHTATGSLAEKYFDLEIITFLKLAHSFAFKVRKKLKTANFHVANISYKNQQYQQYQIIKTLEFNIQVDEGSR